MNNEQIKPIEKEFRDSADNWRANSKLTDAEYKALVLGFILLCYAHCYTRLLLLNKWLEVFLDRVDEHLKKMGAAWS